MAKTFTAAFAQTPKTAIAVTTAAATLTTTPANTVLLMTAGAEGALVTRLSAVPQATATASKLALYISKDSGTTQYFIDSVLMSAYTQAATTATPYNVFPNYSEDSPLRLEAGDQLYVGNMVALAGGVVFRAEYTDF